jgi:hypothetical protein
VLQAFLDGPMSRIGLNRTPIVSGRENVERASISVMREVVDEASYLGRRTEEDLM